MATERIPLVAYLALEPEAHLVAEECDACGARFFDRRNACGACGGRSFEPAPVAVTGHLRAFSIVHRADPGVAVPFVSAIVEACDGTTVRANLLEVTPDPAEIRLGMPVRLVTYPAGTDSEGTECVAFGFAPASA
ncbi:MAG: OB-fold domain-containing protein [bacterium]|nr:OB-fold domain-containing protein [bacterium]MCY3951433.1 OB-fold domain-containing protein [bacterium]MCY4104464.1 OB-fold domain-containing protein [bacterium]